MPDWTDREEAPELGPGWVRMSKKRPDGQQGAKQVDHIWISPEGRRFRSLKNAHEHLSGYPVGQVAAPAKEKKADKPKEKDKKDDSKAEKKEEKKEKKEDKPKAEVKEEKKCV